jgi:hypothetical protein
MAIRWSPAQVIEASDKIEGYINQISKPLERARAAALEAREIPNLPEYVKWRFDTLLSEIARAIGGTAYQPTGTMKLRLTSIREVVPQNALQQERKAIASRAAIQPLLKERG